MRLGSQERQNPLQNSSSQVRIRESQDSHLIRMNIPRNVRSVQQSVEFNQLQISHQKLNQMLKHQLANNRTSESSCRESEPPYNADARSKAQSVMAIRKGTTLQNVMKKSHRKIIRDPSNLDQYLVPRQNEDINEHLTQLEPSTSIVTKSIRPQRTLRQQNQQKNLIRMKARISQNNSVGAKKVESYENGYIVEQYTTKIPRVDQDEHISIDEYSPQAIKSISIIQRKDDPLLKSHDQETGRLTLAEQLRLQYGQPKTASGSGSISLERMKPVTTQRGHQAGNAYKYSGKNKVKQFSLPSA